MKPPSDILHQMEWAMRVFSGLMSCPRFQTGLYWFSGLMWKCGTIWVLFLWDGVCPWWMGGKLESVCARPLWHGSFKRGWWIPIHGVLWGVKECLPLFDNGYGVHKGVVNC